MDENKAYKALKIHDLTPNMAGNYCCKVSTFVDEGYIMQQLNIYGNLAKKCQLVIPLPAALLRSPTKNVYNKNVYRKLKSIFHKNRHKIDPKIDPKVP